MIEPVPLKPVPKRRLLPISAASEYIGIEEQTIRKMVDLGQLRAKRVSGRRMFLLEDLDAWIDAQPDWAENPGKLRMLSRAK